MSYQNKSWEIEMEENNGNNGDNGKRKRPVYYGDAQFIGWNGYTPEEMLIIHEIYEELILTKRYEKAREMELEGKFPFGWLNQSISRIIKRSDRQLREEIVNEFHDRGFSEIWIDKGKVNK